MTPEDFQAALADLGLDQAGLRREIEERSAEAMSPTTVWRWYHGRRKVPPGVAAYLSLRLELHRKGT